MAYTNGSVEDFASIFAAQYEAMKASGALGEDNNLTQQEFWSSFIGRENLPMIAVTHF